MSLGPDQVCCHLCVSIFDSFRELMCLLQSRHSHPHLIRYTYSLLCSFNYIFLVVYLTKEHAGPLRCQ